ncbi:MAG TPA: phage integrase SAM-like domain and Arm DNA-binding domain-containing protein, partial [Chitinophagaceae bacterium]|nr:phage integrase SAM-like domain and Arm DNA-binding domain-containing protein [Chitinophagaceae bacterium]
MNQSFKILFLLKKGKGSVEGNHPVYVRVTVDGKRVEWSVQRNWELNRWNQKTGQALGNKEDAKTLNAFLDSIKGRIYEIQKEYALKKEKLTATLVRSLMRNAPEDKAYSLLEVYQFHNDQFEKLVGVEYSYRTLQKFRTCLKSVRSFLEYQFKREDVPLSYVNHKFLTDYEFYLKTECKLHHNSAMVCMKKLKKIVRLCIANDWLNKDPFKSFKITSKETHRNFLLKDELEK